MKNNISSHYSLRLTFSNITLKHFYLLLAVFFLRIKIIEQNIALKQLKSTPRSMAVQLLLNLSKNLTYFHGLPIRKFVRCSISLEKIGFILHTRVWNNKTQIQMYCRFNQAIIDGGRNACSHGITITVFFCEHSHTFVKIDEFVMEHPCRNGITCTIENRCTSQRGHITWACLTIALEGRS